eukprot:TRINITY_DN95095_c0_g1_i1.p1 TRINITY_DN95095_c0_g1~~TRINITY_DN95095_c0_g1_i1.p1  ORF type:complete len:295 (-),score=40.41 TRINITY_DN95095_c0_g1_i1:6-869(-)
MRLCCCAGRKRSRADDAWALVDLPHAPLTADELLESLRLLSIFYSVQLLRYSDGGLAEQLALDIEQTELLQDLVSMDDHPTAFTLLLQGPYCPKSDIPHDADSEGSSTEDDAEHGGLRRFERILTERRDARAIAIFGLQLEDIEVEPVVASFIAHLLAAANVKLLAFTRCRLDPIVLEHWAAFSLCTLDILTFNNCNLADAHVAVISQRTRDSPVLLAHLRVLGIWGSFSQQALEELLLVLDEQEQLALRILYVPSRHLEWLRTHPFVTAKPSLTIASRPRASGRFS